MDRLSILGLLLGVVSLGAGAAFKKLPILATFWNPAAFSIVIVGTVAAISLQTPPAALKRALQMLVWIFRPPLVQNAALIERIVDWSRAARRKGLLALESEVAKEQDPFIRRGLELVYDGAAADTVRKVMEVEMGARQAADTAGAKVYEGMGIYAPTLGIIGAVLGLMAVMGNLQNQAALGDGIKAAFTATIYGIGLANLFFLPVSNKLKQHIAVQAHSRGMIVDGLAAIADGENPRIIEAKLQGYVLDGTKRSTAPLPEGDRP